MVITHPTPLPDRVVAWIRTDGGDHALLLITIDATLRPHVMMLARDEAFVVSSTQIRVAVGEASQTAENLRLRASATLAIYDADLACAIKTRVLRAPRPMMSGTVACDLAVEDVRLDTPTRAEATARLVSGLRFEGRTAREEVRERLARLAG
jgi:hypothetical protein